MISLFIHIHYRKQHVRRQVLEHFDVNVAFAEVVDDDEAEHGLGNDVERGVADGLSIGGHLAGAFSEDPDDGVEEPGDHGDVHGSAVAAQAAVTEHAKIAVDVVTVLQELRTAVPLAKGGEDGDETKNRKAEEDPLLARADEGTNETTDDHEDVNEDEEQGVVACSAGKGSKLPDHERRSDGPVNVASVVEGAAVAAANNVPVASCHGEIGEGCEHADETSDNTMHAH